MNWTDELELQKVDADSIPEPVQGTGGRRTSGYTIILTNFLESGERAAMVVVPEDRNFKNIVQGLSHARKRHGLTDEVSVLTRGGEVYLVRK